MPQPHMMFFHGWHATCWTSKHGHKRAFRGILMEQVYQMTCVVTWNFALGFRGIYRMASVSHQGEPVVNRLQRDLDSFEFWTWWRLNRVIIVINWLLVCSWGG